MIRLSIAAGCILWPLLCLATFHPVLLLDTRKHYSHTTAPLITDVAHSLSILVFCPAVLDHHPSMERNSSHRPATITLCSQKIHYPTIGTSAAFNAFGSLQQHTNREIHLVAQRCLSCVFCDPLYRLVAVVNQLFAQCSSSSNPPSYAVVRVSLNRMEQDFVLMRHLDEKSGN